MQVTLSATLPLKPHFAAQKLRCALQTNASAKVTLLRGLCDKCALPALPTWPIHNFAVQGLTAVSQWLDNKLLWPLLVCGQTPMTPNLQGNKLSGHWAMIFVLEQVYNSTVHFCSTVRYPNSKQKTMGCNSEQCNQPPTFHKDMQTISIVALNLMQNSTNLNSGCTAAAIGNKGPHTGYIRELPEKKYSVR